MKTQKPNPRRARSMLWDATLLCLGLLLPACSDAPTRGTDGTVTQTDAGRTDRGPLADTAVAGDRRRSDLPGPDRSAAPDAALPCGPLAASVSDRSALTWLLSCVRSALPKASRMAAIDRFVARVELSGGFPILVSGKATFVYIRGATYDAEDDRFTAEDYALSRRKVPISVAGAFNGWKPGSVVMKQEPLDLFWVETTVDLSNGDRSPYKLVANDAAGKTVWFSDPLSRRFGFDKNGRYSLIRGGKDTSSGKAVGHLEWIRAVKANKLGGARPLFLYIPHGYDKSTATNYPVIYLHDGNNLYDIAQPRSNGSWDVDGVADSEIAAGRVKPFIGVGIPNTAARVDEYTHVQDAFSYGGKVVKEGGKGKDYLDFVVNDVKPLVDKRYRTKSAREYTAILGSSLGGLISFYAGLQHPTVFKYIGGMSSTLGWGNFGLKNPTMEQLYAAHKNLKGLDQVYYLDSGDNPKNTKNPPICPNSNVEAEDNYCETISFRDMLVKAGIKTFPQNPNSSPLQPKNINIYHYYQPDAPHNEAAWAVRLFRPLRLFFRP